MYDTSVVKCIWCLDDVKEILEPACGHLRLTMHIHFCRNVISIEYMASTCCNCCCCIFLNCNYKFSTHKILFQGYSYNILIIFLIFFKFHPWGSYSINSYVKRVWVKNLFTEGGISIYCLFSVWPPLDSPPHWRSQSWGYEYLWMDVSWSTVEKLPLIITGKGQ